ncbi:MULTISPECIES: TetR/AcrR family transcriptional regulator [unclassified Ensifer]|uniref:TetR/AcrR family transcriptional regulator n=1 Tax=unclassified Ensifer TaxID=2633371 RepID=UPI000A69D873|nr:MULTISPECIES: TetR/AcrR family transcriptional regulator [unclassified Ensifer]
MSSLCTRLGDPGKEKDSGSASMTRDAHWASGEHKPNSQALEVFSRNSDGVVLARWRRLILDVAEEHIRRIGHRKTTVADIAFNLGVSRANVYRFFPTRAAINESVCAQIANRTLDVAREISKKGAPAGSRLAGMFAALHRHTQLQLAEERHSHELFVAAIEGKWEVAKWYFDEMTRIFEATIREGLEAGELKSGDAGDAARCVMAAIVSFVHPGLIEQRIGGGEDVEDELEAQTRFVLWALENVPGPPLGVREFVQQHAHVYRAET